MKDNESEENIFDKYFIADRETGAEKKGKYFVLRLDAEDPVERVLVMQAMKSYLKALYGLGRSEFANHLAEYLDQIGLFDATCRNGSFFPSIPLAFKKLDKNARLPEYAHNGDAGMDVFALEDVTVFKGKPTLVRTGLAAEIPPGYEIQVRPRSGLALKGITVWNSPGTIDAKYRGEIGVILNFSNSEGRHYDDATGGVVQNATQYTVHAGDKIAQLVLAPITVAKIMETDTLSETDRGTGGFGSTGT